MVWGPIGRALRPTDMGCPTCVFGPDGSADAAADGSDAAGVVALAVAGAGGAGKPPAIRKFVVCRVTREGE